MRARPSPNVTALVSLVVWTACQPTSSHTAREASFSHPPYEVTCPVDAECHESVALLVGLSAPSEPMRCTAALVGPNRAVTAGHCVARALARGGRCDDVWLGFAGTSEHPAEWIACARIDASSAFGEGLFAPDFAVLELTRSSGRHALRLGRGGVGDGEVLRMVSVTVDRFYDELHQVRSRRCIVNPGDDSAAWATTAPPSVRVLSSCPIHLGSSGSPLLDQSGRMRGLVHAGGPPFFAFGLMTEADHIVEPGHALDSLFSAKPIEGDRRQDHRNAEQ